MPSRSAQPSHSRVRRMAVPAAMLLAVTVGGGHPAGAAPAEHSDSPVFTIPPPFPPSVAGSSHLVRNGNGVTLNVQTSGLEPGDAVTLWVIVANDPADCTTPPGTSSTRRGPRATAHTCASATPHGRSSRASPGCSTRAAPR
jgi:hypothetical protein